MEHLNLILGAIAGVLLIVSLFCYKIILRVFGIVLVPENHLGIVNKKFVLFGSNKALPDGKVIALNGESGWQADALPQGVHFWYWPWQYELEFHPFTIIETNKVGVVESTDGTPLSGGRVLAKDVSCDAFQNARDFLTKGGERGPQISVIPPGTYRINPALFKVTAAPVVDISDNTVGIVTTKEGLQLPKNDIAGPEVPNHNSFQDGQKFVNEGGYKGLQTQVLLAGRYFLNPRFVTIDPQPMTTVPIAHVGAVISYVGKEGRDVSGDSFKHGNLVVSGEKGVWESPLDPGKYPINPHTHKVEIVPTANVVLNWATGKNESHKLDEKLSTITVRSGDGFTFNLDVSQIIHVPRNEAPKVIARFGSMQNLVTQVLEPLIANYFRNTAQGFDVIDFLKNRSERQKEARQVITEALNEYNVNAVDTLIGDISPPKELMKTLTDRKIAEQEKRTFEQQRIAQDTRKDLEQATAMANTQAVVVDAERKVTIARFGAESSVETAKGDGDAAKIRALATAEVNITTAKGLAEAKKTQADADAAVLIQVGAAEAEKTLKVGQAEADVIKLKIASVEAGNYAGIEIAKALAASGHKLVPEMVVGGHGSGSNGLVDVLLGNLITSQAKNNGHSS